MRTRLAGVVFEEVNRLGGVGIGFDPTFARFEHHDGAELVLAPPHLRRRAQQIARPLLG